MILSRRAIHPPPPNQFSIEAQSFLQLMQLPMRCCSCDCTLVSIGSCVYLTPVSYLYLRQCYSKQSSKQSSRQFSTSRHLTHIFKRYRGSCISTLLVYSHGMRSWLLPRVTCGAATPETSFGVLKLGSQDP